MDRSAVFDRLSEQLADEDRRHMLASIRKSMESEAAPLAPESEPDPLPVENQIELLGFWKRFLLILAQLFIGRDREETVKQWMLRDLEQQIQRTGGDAVDVRRRAFRESFAVDLEALAECSAALEPVMRNVIRRRTELVLTLAMYFFPGIHRELLHRTGEGYIASLNEESERYLKRRLSDYLDDAMNDIPPEHRSAMRNALAQADMLMRLLSFSYRSMLNSFDDMADPTARQCAFDYLSRSLVDLYETLSAFHAPLDLTLLETIVLFANEDERRDEGPVEEEEFQEAVRSGLEELLDGLRTFRSFAARYPLLKVIRLVREDPWWNHHVESGGEDWFALYRAFFVDRIQRQVLRVSLHNQLRKYLSDLSELCGPTLRPLEGLPAGDMGSRTYHWYLGLALRTFVSTIWTSVLPHLRIILTSGEFYKSSNRAQFNDAYNEFEQIPDRIENLERSLEPDQAWGIALSGGQDAMHREKMARRIDQELQQIAKEARITLESLVNLLGGILYARPGSSYDTIANFGQIGGRRNAELVDELKESHHRLAGFLGVMGEIDAVERRAIEHNISVELGLRSPTAT